MQFLNSYLTLHSRSEFEDYPEPERRRHLLRLWLGHAEQPPAAGALQGPVRDR